MNISKTLFKNLTRCNNFASFYDLYINRGFHEVKEIDGTLINDINSLDDNLFNEENEKLEEIFSEMFDSETGVDLLSESNPQLEAFQDTFTEVERLASIYIKELINQNVIASTDTYKQKKYTYHDSGNTFYCFLDIYFEDEKEIKVFEVKATTSKKYDEFMITVGGKKIPLFEMDSDGIMKYVGRNIIGKVFNNKTIDEKIIQKKEQTLLNRYTKEGKYIYDVAVERHIIENSIKEHASNNKKISYYLVVLNSKYHFSGKYDENNNPIYEKDMDGNELFKVYDVNSLTEFYQNSIIEEKDILMNNLNHLVISNNHLGKFCEYKKTTECKFCKICFKNVLVDGSILEYMGKHYAFSEEDNNKRKIVDVYDLINDGKYMLSSVRDYITKPNNIVQYNCYVDNKIYIDKARIKEGIKSIKYPIYYLDFESYNSPLPRFYMERPYEQSLFQYSLHVEKEEGICDIEKNHFEFLAKDHQDHRLELVKKLIKDIDLTNGGSVIVYNKSFEKTRLKELANIYPMYKDSLDKINDHIFDLLEVLKGSTDLYDIEDDMPSFTYYNNRMHGSFSIKKILPLFTNLTYSSLDVKNGTEAIVAYGLLPKLSKKEYEEKYLSLSVYCRQDTWAMVEILRGLKEEIKK